MIRARDHIHDNVPSRTTALQSNRQTFTLRPVITPHPLGIHALCLVHHPRRPAAQEAAELIVGEGRATVIGRPDALPVVAIHLGWLLVWRPLPRGHMETTGGNDCREVEGYSA